MFDIDVTESAVHSCTAAHALVIVIVVAFSMELAGLLAFDAGNPKVLQDSQICEIVVAH